MGTPGSSRFNHVLSPLFPMLPPTKPAFASCHHHASSPIDIHDQNFDPSRIADRMELEFSWNATCILQAPLANTPSSIRDCDPIRMAWNQYQSQLRDTCRRNSIKDFENHQVFNFQRAARDKNKISGAKLAMVAACNRIILFTHAILDTALSNLMFPVRTDLLSRHVPRAGQIDRHSRCV